MTVQTNSARMTWELAQNGTAVSGPVTMLLSTGIVLMNGAFTPKQHETFVKMLERNERCEIPD